MEKKLQIVETPDYVLAVSDEEIKEGDIIWNQNTNTIAVYTGHGSMEWWKKIIGYRPKGNAPELDLTLLLDFNEDDVERLACKLANENEYVWENTETSARGVFRMWAKDKSANKTYSETDVLEAMEKVFQWFIDNRESTTIVSDVILKCLRETKSKTPKYFIAETIRYSDEELYKVTELKTTRINGKVYLCGTYSNE